MKKIIERLNEKRWAHQQQQEAKQHEAWLREHGRPVTRKALEARVRRFARQQGGFLFKKLRTPTYVNIYEPSDRFFVPGRRLIYELLFFGCGAATDKILLTNKSFLMWCRKYKILHENEFLVGEFDEESMAA
jgi:hypothetical protein